jgi:hypothetical protein
MEKEEIVNEIKRFFSLKKGDVEIERSWTEVVVKFKEDIELTEEGYERLHDFLKNLGFLPSDIWENAVIEAWGYRSWISADVFKNYKNGIELNVYYTKVWTKGETRYFVNRIDIEEIEDTE